MNITEYYHNKGKLPNKYYNQLNGKTANENYQKEKEKMTISLSAEAESQIKNIIEKSLNDILKDFTF